MCTYMKSMHNRLNSTIVSEGLSFNVNSAIFQLYHGENKLIFNEMMMRSWVLSTLNEFTYYSEEEEEEGLLCSRPTC